jgi:hypothetical protein
MHSNNQSLPVNIYLRPGRRAGELFKVGTIQADRRLMVDIEKTDRQLPPALAFPEPPQRPALLYLPDQINRMGHSPY